jgi:hypothetical protein
MTPWEFYGALEGWVENLHDRRLERGLAVLGIDPEREEQYEADLAASRERARLARERGEVNTDG